jgi:hypothetical protein
MEAVKDIRDDWPAAMAQQQRPNAKQARLDVGLGDTMEEIDSIGVRIGFINDLLQEVRGVAGSCWLQQGRGMGHTCSLHAARRMVEQMGGWRQGGRWEGAGFLPAPHTYMLLLQKVCLQSQPWAALVRCAGCHPPLLFISGVWPL